MSTNRFALKFKKSALIVSLCILMIGLTGCPRRPATITITPTEASIEVGATVALTAESSNANDTISWTSENEAIATVDASGLVTGVSEGQTAITATGSASGVSASATVTVTRTPDIEVTVTPSAAEITEGETVSLSATSTDPNDTIAWSSDDVAIATVDSVSGLVTGVSPGVVRIVATGSNSGASGSADITVTEIVPEVVVTVTPEEATIEVDETVSLTAESTDTEDTISWSSEDESIATVDSETGLVTGVSPGTVSIHATGSNSGKTGSAEITVVEKTPVVVVTVMPSEATIEVDLTVSLSAESTDPEDTFTWSSEDDTIATVDSETGLVLGISPGEVKIIATGSNSGVAGSAVITVIESTAVEPLEDVEELRRILAAIPEEYLDDEDKNILRRYLDETEEALLDGKVCEAAEIMDSYLGKSQELRVAADGSVMPDPFWAADLLYAEGRMLQYDMLLSSANKENCPGFERVGMAIEAEVLDGDATGLEAVISFGAPRMWVVQHEEADRTFTQLHVPDSELESGEPGYPFIPSVRHLVAVPPDSDVMVDFEVKIAENFLANLYPIQAQPADQNPDDVIPEDLIPPPEEVFANLPFIIDDELYESDAVWPPQPVAITPLGRYRELELVHVEVFGGNFNPRTNEVQLYENVELNIAHRGKEQGFLSNQFTRNPFESKKNLIIESVFNKEIVAKTPSFEIVINWRLIGEEYLILTHPNFRSAAENLAAWKRQKGIMTNVFEVGTNTGISGRQTRDEIKAFIKDRYETTLVKASYILLLGDAEFITPFYRSGIYGSIGTDWPYAVLSNPGQADPLVPTFAIGRIPVDTIGQANAVVDKIINYEKNPPGSFFGPNPFYQNVTLASQFQCCRTDVNQVGRAQRTFTQVSEFVRSALVGSGYSVQRIYELTVDNAYNADPTPRRYYDGAQIPAAIGPGSGFNWNGSRTDIINAFNAGRFLMIHRDLGWHSGWGHPPFNSTDASSLGNAPFLPVVYSINCSSGLFDNETAPGAEGSSVNGIYFAERLLRNPTGGAVGIIGDTRISPSWPNSALLRGLIDATWPNTIPNFGGNNSHRRLGDIMNHAKAYLATQVGVAGQSTSQAAYESMLRLYHVIGDPTLEMWTKNPHVFPLTNVFTIKTTTQSGLILSYDTNDTEVTLYQESEIGLNPIGRGITEDGEVEIEYFNSPNPDLPLLVSATLENSIAVSGEVYQEF